MIAEISVKTVAKDQMANITAQVQKIVSDSKVKQGTCLVFCPHTTAGITVNENADPDVPYDIQNALSAIVPNLEFKHREGNSDAHLKSSLVGCEKSFIIQNGKLLLGEWQGIFFMEADGPRQRKVIVRVVQD